MRFTEITKTAEAVAILALAGLIGLAAAPRSAAQCGNAGDVAQNCLPQNNPTAVEQRDFSRVVRGEAFVGPATQVRIRQCGTNVRTRNVSNLGIVLNLCQPRECDELTLPPPCFVPPGYILTGLYNSAVRLNDPCANVDATGVVRLNPRIGTFNARGDVLNCNGVKVGLWTLEGTVGTNSSAPPLHEGCGDCYVCDHHTGLLKITGLKDSGTHCPPSSITAFIQFDTNKTNCPVPGPTCDTLNRCEVAFIVQDGTADGVYQRPCCFAVDDPTGGGNNPNAAIVADPDFGDVNVLEVIELP